MDNRGWVTVDLQCKGWMLPSRGRSTAAIDNENEGALEHSTRLSDACSVASGHCICLLETMLFQRIESMCYHSRGTWLPAFLGQNLCDLPLPEEKTHCELPTLIEHIDNNLPTCAWRILADAIDLPPDVQHDTLSLI